MKKFLLILLILFALPAYSLEVSYEAALNYYKAGEYKKALKMINKVEEQGRRNAEISLLKYELYRNTNKLKEAKEALLDAVKYDEECYEAYAALAVLSLENFNPSEAKRYFKKVMEINPELESSPDILYYFAKICILDKDLDSALDYILSAIKLNSDESLYYLELGKIYLEKKDYLRAVNALEYCIGSDFGINSEAYNYIGLANYGRGNFKQAEKYFKMAVDSNESIVYLNNLALCYKTISDKENYEKTISKILNITPQKPIDYIELSRFYLDRKNYEAALFVVKKGLEKYPDNLYLKGAEAKLNKL